MSKLLKRTFALALIFCMLLSVIPAVSAEDTAEDAIVYNFNAAYNNGTKISAPNGVTADLYTAGALYEDAASTKPLNWYYLKEARDTDAAFQNGGIYENEGIWDWIALVIDVPTTGKYDIIAETYCSGNGDPGGVYTLIEMATNTNIVNATGTGKNKFHDGTYTTALEAHVDATLRNTAGGKKGYVYLGNVPLNKGLYVFTMQKDKDAAGSNQKTIVSLTLTPNTTASFVNLINQHDPKVQESDRPVYQLAADLVAPEADLVLSNAELALRGKNLTVKSISYNDEEPNKKNHGNYGMISDKSGTSVVTAQRVTLPTTTQTKLLMNIKDTSTYKLYNAPTFTMKATPGNTVLGIEDTEKAAKAKTFGFQIALDDAVFTECSFDDLKVTLNVGVIGGEVLPVSYHNEDAAKNYVKQWAAMDATERAGQYFYVTIANCDLLVGETLAFEAVVSCNGAEYTTQASYEVPEA